MTAIAWPSINRNCFLSAITVLFPFFKGNFFDLAINWYTFLRLTMKPSSFKELPALGSSNVTCIVLQSKFDLLSMCLNVPIEPLILINLSETLILSVNSTLAPTYNFSFTDRLAF